MYIVLFNVFRVWGGRACPLGRPLSRVSAGIVSGRSPCVGAYARLYLASIYAKQGKTSEAEKLKEEIRTQFPDAVTHKGRPMKDAL